MIRYNFESTTAGRKALESKDRYPLPRIDEDFLPLDLRNGYWTVELRKNCEKKTVFTLDFEFWQFYVMSLVLCNTPATVDRLMENILRCLS